MKQTRIAVLGLYRSGSTAVAGALHYLGVDMGPPFFEGYFESAWLSKQLRLWWDEPHLREKASRAKRVRVLAKWIEERERGGANWVGMKHPLLSLCGDDLVEAWGKETAFIRCSRPLEESIDSLERLGVRADNRFMQGTLFTELDRFFAGREYLRIEFADMMNCPERQIQRIVEYLRMKPDPDKLASAFRFVEPGKRSKVEIEQRANPPAAGRFSARAFLGALRKVVSIGEK
jgi:hypothetical protein